MGQTTRQRYSKHTTSFVFPSEKSNSNGWRKSNVVFTYIIYVYIYIYYIYAYSIIPFSTGWFFFLFILYMHCFYCAFLFLEIKVKGKIICLTNRHSKDILADMNALDWQFPTSDGQMPSQLAFRQCQVLASTLANQLNTATGVKGSSTKILSG